MMFFQIFIVPLQRQESFEGNYLNHSLELMTIIRRKRRESFKRIRINSNKIYE